MSTSILENAIAPAEAQPFEVKRVAGRIGAEIIGLRLSGDMPTETIDAIKAALWKHKVLFFRGQTHLDDDGHADFVKLLGPLWTIPTIADEEIARMGAFYELDSTSPDGRADSWHTDSTFCVDPPLISVLRASVMPEYGGDTAWANCAAAYQALPKELQELADKLWVRHSNKVDYAGRRPNATQEQIRHFEEVTTRKTTISDHPMVHVHEHSGEKVLLVGRERRIVGYEVDTSNRIIEMLQAYISDIANTVRWNWTVGDIAMWDNQATQHIGINDYGDQKRKVRRLTVVGNPLTGVDGRKSVAVRKPGE